MMKKFTFIITALFTVFIGTIYSAPPPPPPAGGPGCWPPPCIPIDNGLLFLILAGVIFGAKKLYNSYKNSSSVC